MTTTNRDICFIDSFSAGLDDLPLRKQRSTREVLKHLDQAGEFSTFEATENDVIATTMDRLQRHGYIEIENRSYPWSNVKLTDLGKQYLNPNGGSQTNVR